MKALAEHPDRQAADIVRLLLLTGARRGEVLAARWADVDLGKGIWSKPPSSTKQKDAPRGAAVRTGPRAAERASASEQAGKPARARRIRVPRHRRERPHRRDQEGVAALIKAAGITGLRIHDLRHSFASAAGIGGASLPLIGALLGHASPATTHRYATCSPTRSVRRSSASAS